MAMIARAAISASVMPTILLGFSLLSAVWFGDSIDGVVGVGVLGMTAIAGEVVSEIFGGSDRVEGIEQRVFSGCPHKPILPEKDSVFWLSNGGVLGIGPVRLLKERSRMALAGNFSVKDGDIMPKI